MYIAIPLKGVRSGYEDAYNFYLSQLRITIERTFGVFVHRWAILRAPLTIPIQKVAPLIESLVRLHNFCINENETMLLSLESRNADNLKRNVLYSQEFHSGRDAEFVEIDNEGRPASMIGNCSHFSDAEKYRYDRNLGVTPMEKMIESVRQQKLRRPKY